MKIRFISCSLTAAAAAIAVTCAVAPVNAATIDWSQANKVASNADVSTGGSLVEAYSFSNGAATSPDVNNVIFTGVTAGGHTLTFGSNSDTLVDSATGTATLGGYNGYGSPTALSSLTAYDSLLTSGAYDGTSTTNGTLTLSLNNLTVGNTYQYEMWVNDTRVGSTIADRFVNVTAGNTVGLLYQTPASTSTTKNGGEFAIGNFTADATSEVVSIKGNSDAQINAFELLTGGALPNPGLVTNSGFESNPVSTSGFAAYTAGSTAITGWTVDPTTAADIGGVQIIGMHFNGSGYGIQFAPQNQGQVLQLTDSSTAAGGVQQTLATVAGQQYSISVDLAARSYTGTSAINLGTLDFGGTVFNLTGTDYLEK
ncbi:MAG: hypothetical protein ACP5I8_09840 [Phycisphaerae bacterium]